jgi:hypothetical protein
MLLDEFDTPQSYRVALNYCDRADGSFVIYSLGEICAIWVLLRYPNLKPPGYPCWTERPGSHSKFKLLQDFTFPYPWLWDDTYQNSAVTEIPVPVPVICLKIMRVRIS